MARILLHACCGPCAAYIVKSLRERDLELSLFWYNPNIHPFREHQLRLDAIKSLAAAERLSLIVDEGYDMIRYFRTVVGKERERCPECYRLRLARTAQAAHEKRFDSFTTTLLISPYQDHQCIRESGEALGIEHGVPFHYEDFRHGFREGHRMARELGFYHQSYCGCVYSEWERYGKIKI
ncbi:MAG: epoxyqueuosine reductase QueH [Dehalococcoidia bacterium]|nr:epoxyqueuosine reductase QueH [Dehalococcoidia bacterium]